MCFCRLSLFHRAEKKHRSRASEWSKGAAMTSQRNERSAEETLLDATIDHFKERKDIVVNNSSLKREE